MSPLSFCGMLSDNMYFLIPSAIVLLAALKCYTVLRGRKDPRLPPGPPGHWLIGNLFDMPASHKWIKFSEWGRSFGPVTHLNVAGKSILVLNTHEAAVALLDKRATIYSGRPRMVMVVELSGFGHATAFLPHGPIHKKHRRLLGQALHPNVVLRDFVPLIRKQSHHLAQSLLDDPDNFVDHIHRFTGEVVQTVTYGRSHDGDVDLVELGIEGMGNLAKALGGYLVDMFPWMKYMPEWFPGAGFKREARRISAIANSARFLPFNMVKREAASGIAPRSFVLSALEAQAAGGTGAFDDDVISGAAATLFGAGSRTVAGTLHTFMLAMTLHPEIQDLAREELERVFGDRPLDVGEREATAYINAIILETLRWSPVMPTGLPHRLAQDDMYNGRFLPAGSIVFVNAWGILHDERRYPEPFAFKPERWLSETPSEKGAHRINPWDVSLGYGRRICQGMALAQAELWIAITTILLSFEIRMKVHPISGLPTEPEVGWTGGSSSVPEPFQCNIVPRSPNHAGRVRALTKTEGS